MAVVETRAYLARAERLLSREEQDEVVEMVAREPTCGDLIEGTRGVRKVRFAIGGRGKSGGNELAKLVGVLLTQYGRK